MTYVTTGEAARVLDVGLNTIKRWIASGALQGVQTPGGHWRIPERALEHLMQTQGIVIPEQDKENPVRILIVDDEPHVCTLLKAILQDAEFLSDVKCAHDGYTGLIQIGSWRPDILLLDVFMPGIDGIEVLQRLQADHELAGDMKIIVVTAAFDRPILKQALDKVKPDALLPKPVDAQQLLAAVDKCLASKTLQLNAT